MNTALIPRASATTDRANTALAFVSLAKDGNRTFSFYRNPSADMLFSAEQIEDNCSTICLHFISAAYRWGTSQ